MSNPMMVTTPLADAINAHYDGLRRDELLITRCTECGRSQFPPRAVCYGCSASGTLEWVRSPGTGVVWSHVTFHKAYFKPEVRGVPYNVAVVQLDEGPRLVTNVVGVPDEDIVIGMKVCCTFVHDDRGDLVVFQPDPDHANDTDAPTGASTSS